MRAARITTAVIVALTFATTALVYSRLPATVATHWGPSGQADGYASVTSVWLLPAIAAVTALFVLWLPSIMPLKSNIGEFRKQYDWFVAVFAGFFFLMNAWTLAWNLGHKVSANVVMPLLMGPLFIYLGWVMRSAKRNWVFGIRTSWTLSDDRVWAETHRVGSWLWMAGGAAAMVGALFPDYGIWFVLGPITVASLASVAYSYVVWVRLGRPENGGGASARDA